MFSSLINLHWIHDWTQDLEEWDRIPFLKIYKIWHPGVIKYLQEKGLAPRNIYTDMVPTKGDDTPGLSTVQKWVAEFMLE